MLNLIRLTITRARKERLPQVAGSLTFTTLLSIVPLLAVSLALLARFAIFDRLAAAIDEIVLKGLLPADIARPVLRHLHQFVTNAIGLTWIGSLLLLLAALALLLTVENTFNQIWQVRRNRPLIKRVLLYLLVLAAGPPVLGLSLWAWSSVLGASLGLLATLPPALTFVLGLGPALLVLALLTGLFYVVPNTGVRFGDAIVGALLASVALELGKRGFAAYLVKLPSYRALYGSFAVLPLFMLWVYFSWLVTLIAALIAANLGRTRRPPPRRI